MSDIPVAASLESAVNCPICGREMEDQRHVAVECFYDVHEVAPSATKTPMFVEVPEDAAIWGVTRRYEKGTRDRNIVSEAKGETKGGVAVLHLERVPEPIGAIRLAEMNHYSVTCCKSCRADFLRLFGMWARGEVVGRESSRPDAVVPIRDLGAIRYVTEEEAHRRRANRDGQGEPTRVGTKDNPSGDGE